MPFQFIAYPAVLSGGGASLGTAAQVFSGAGGTIVGASNGVNLVFTLPVAPLTAGGTEVFLDGLLQRQTIDYTLAGSTITFVVAPNFGQIVDVFYFQ